MYEHADAHQEPPKDGLHIEPPTRRGHVAALLRCEVTFLLARHVLRMDPEGDGDRTGVKPQDQMKYLRLREVRRIWSEEGE